MAKLSEHILFINYDSQQVRNDNAQKLKQKTKFSNRR